MAEQGLDALAELLLALAHPIRLEILKRLRTRPMHWSFLLHEFGCSRQAVVRHLNMLEAAGFITTQPEPQWHVYRVDTSRLLAFLSTFSGRFAANSDKINSICDT